MIIRASAPALVQNAMPRNQRPWPGRGAGTIAVTAAITAGPHTSRLSRKLNPMTFAPNVAGVGLAEGVGEVATVSSHGAMCGFAASSAVSQPVMDAAPP